MSTTIMCPDGKPRCNWCSAAPEFIDYHDSEWGFPVSDDHRLFEKLCLEPKNKHNKPMYPSPKSGTHW